MTPYDFTPPAAAARALKWLLAAGAAIILLFSAWFFLIRPEAALRRAATAETEQIIAESQAGAAQQTIGIVVDHRNEVETITHRTEVTTDEILSAPGADQAIDPDLHAAGLRALCLQDGRRDPLCSELLHRDGAGVGAD